MSDTSTEGVEFKAAILAQSDLQYLRDAAATLRALLAERDRMKRALEIIRDMVVDGVSFNTIARGGLGEERDVR